MRKHYGLSQRELARRAEMTNSTLSMIEQGKVSPSVSSLEKILAAFPLSLQEFFSDSYSFSKVIYRREDWVTVNKSGAEFRLLPIGRAQLQSEFLAYQEFSPGAKIQSDWLVRKGQVSGIVIEGALELHLDGGKHYINSGEGFSFSLQRNHEFLNTGTDKLIIVCVSLNDR